MIEARGLKTTTMRLILGLADVAGKRSKGFSLGMRQRLGIAAVWLGDLRIRSVSAAERRVMVARTVRSEFTKVRSAFWSLTLMLLASTPPSRWPTGACSGR